MHLIQGVKHWKVDCPNVKGKKKESKTEANLAQVVSTHANTSQAMDRTQSHQYFLSLLLFLLLVTQIMLSGS